MPLAARVEMPRGCSICLAVDHDGCAPRAVHYASKLLLKSRQDRVTLLHVQKTGHPHNSGSGRLGPVQGHHRQDPGSCAAGQSLAVEPTRPGAGWKHAANSEAFHGGLGSPADGSQDMRHWGSSSSSMQTSGHPYHPGKHEGCSELLEQCRQQLLAKCKRMQPDHVRAELLPATWSPKKAIAKFVSQEGCGILLMGTRSHGKLLTLIGHGGSTSRYCCEHLPGTRVVVLRPED